VSIRISKLDAARRQLASAIRLWFHNDDVVTIHALAWAAYQLIEDINRHKGNNDATLVAFLRQSVPPELVETTMQFWRKSMTFFKHANRDPHDILEFDPAHTELVFMLAFNGLKELGERMGDIERAFMLWQRFHVPSMYLDGKSPVEQGWPVELVQRLKSLSKEQFLETCLLYIAQLRSQGKL
jgi:hypothetical protein